MSGARERIGAWIAATRRVTRHGGDVSEDRARESALVDAIADESGLSRRGVHLALGGLLEVDRADAELARFLENPSLVAIGVRPRVAVVLSSTVPIAGFRAIAWALAQSSQVVVRPSRRCRALVSAICDEMPDHVEIATPSDRPEDDLRSLVASLPERGALHVYGGEEATGAAKEATKDRPDLHVELHGPGFGAVVAPAAVVVEGARAIATDVAAFDQRGCLSPRALLVVGDASAAADALHASLELLDGSCPRGALDDDERAAIALARAAALFAGRALDGEGHTVLDLGLRLGVALGAVVGPVGRVVPVLGVRDLAEAIEHLRPLAAQLTHVATIDAWRESISAVAPTCALGEMQRPPFDGPVDRRIR